MKVTFSCQVGDAALVLAADALLDQGGKTVPVRTAAGIVPGVVESAEVSDDGTWVEITLEADIPETAQATLGGFSLATPG